MTERRADWLQRMWDTLEAWRDVPFEYGRADCCRFAAAVVDAMCDTSHLAALTYTNRAEAAQWIADAGSIELAVSAVLGPSTQGYPRRGDVVLLPGDDGDAIGVSVGDTFVAYREAGLVRVTYHSTAHWRV